MRGKVFISHSHADNALCEPLLEALRAWGVEYWFDTERLVAGQVLTNRIQAEIAASDVFIRVGTASVMRNSYWVNLETDAFRALQADDARSGRGDRRILISIVMDTYYVPQLFEKTLVYIDAARQPLEAWQRELRRVLLPGSPDAPRDITPHNPLIVDWQQTGDFARISRAIDAAHDGQTIVIKPGVYREALRIYKNLELRGEGKPGDIVVIAEGSDVVLVDAAKGRIANMTLRQAGGRGQWYGIDVARGEVEIVDCEITSGSLACIGVHGQSKPIITRCTIHSGAQSGLYFYEGATGLVENCDIYANALHGIAAQGSSQPTVRGSRIHDNHEDGIYISGGSAGLYEDNDISSNHQSGIVVAGGGHPKCQRNTVRGNGMLGLRVSERSGGVFEGNDFRQNKGGSKVIAPDSQASITYKGNRE
jgi:parallel beta-helix repeat protein